MAASTAVQIWCDRCPAVVLVGADQDSYTDRRYRDARAVMALEGWRYEGGQDLCPAHRISAN